MEGAIGVAAICLCIAVCVKGWPTFITINKNYYNKEK